MKNARMLIATALLFAAVSVYVQAQERQLLTATIPFAFTVENSNLPAGTYTISTLPPYNMMKVQSADGRKVVMIPTIPSPTSAESKQTKLVFDRIGSQYFLSQVWEQGSNLHRDLRSGKLTREFASSGGRVQSTTILASANGSR
ncbi:MAG: hypothetical protein WCA20_22255 [Candidatus Sulfotelmatobacter sp.]